MAGMEAPGNPFQRAYQECAYPAPTPINLDNSKRDQLAVVAEIYAGTGALLDIEHLKRTVTQMEYLCKDTFSQSWEVSKRCQKLEEMAESFAQERRKESRPRNDRMEFEMEYEERPQYERHKGQRQKGQRRLGQQQNGPPPHHGQAAMGPPQNGPFWNGKPSSGPRRKGERFHGPRYNGNHGGGYGNHGGNGYRQ
jgi:hypothetical protein